jgi:CRP-like cAMP-binding protein
LKTASPAPDIAALKRSALQYSLSQTAIFSGLPEADLTRIAGYAELRSVRRGAYLFREGDPVVGFFIVRSGSIYVHRTNPQGGEQIIHSLLPGDSFAERAMVASNGYPANARAVQDSEVILIPIDNFKRHQRDRPDLAWRMISSMSHHLRALVASLEGLRFTDSETRLLHWILQRCPASSSRKRVEIPLKASQTVLARELATRRETLSRMLRRLRDLGLIELEKRTLLVLDLPGLRRHFEEKSAA